MTIRILLADDHQIVREGLSSLLTKEGHGEIVGEAADGRTAVKLARQLQPDLVVIDVAMPELNGIEATQQILRDHPATRVIVLSMHADATYVGRALKAGAAAYLLKDCAFEELAEALSRVHSGGIYLSPGITGVVVDDYVRKLDGTSQPGESAAAKLTPKEREVLQLVAEGHSTKQIAQALHVSVKTIETHRQNIMNKLELRSIAELTKFAIREGLTSLDH
ncbi:MAG: response regulator transcription factor [Planctomycetota bacterium]